MAIPAIAPTERVCFALAGVLLRSPSGSGGETLLVGKGLSAGKGSPGFSMKALSSARLRCVSMLVLLLVLMAATMP